MTMEMDNAEMVSSVGAAATVAGDAVGLSPAVPERPLRWYVAVVNNNTEKLCRDRMESFVKDLPGGVCGFEAYVPVQREMRVWRNGRRRPVDRVVLPAVVFVRCTESVRRREVASLPFVKRFLVNTAGSLTNGHRPVAVIPDSQMAALMRMVGDADSPVTIDSRPLRLGERVRVNGGRLIGLEGRVLREADGTTSLVIRMDILGSARVTISRDLLDPIV